VNTLAGREFLVCSVLSHQEASSGLLNSSKLHLVEKQRQMNKESEGGMAFPADQRAARRFVCLIPPASMLLHAPPPRYRPFFTPTQTEFTVS